MTQNKTRLQELKYEFLVKATWNINTTRMKQNDGLKIRIKKRELRIFLIWLQSQAKCKLIHYLKDSCKTEKLVLRLIKKSLDKLCSQNYVRNSENRKYD